MVVEMKLHSYSLHDAPLVLLRKVHQIELGEYGKWGWVGAIEMACFVLFVTIIVAIATVAAGMERFTRVIFSSLPCSLSHHYQVRIR